MSFHPPSFIIAVPPAFFSKCGRRGWDNHPNTTTEELVECVKEAFENPKGDATWDAGDVCATVLDMGSNRFFRLVSFFDAFSPGRPGARQACLDHSGAVRTILEHNKVGISDRGFSKTVCIVEADA